MISNKGFWGDRRVFITGHTGFKGSWLSIWLSELGAATHGYALPPAGEQSLFEDAGVDSMLNKSVYGNILDQTSLGRAMETAQPEVVFHMAAQPLVRASYEDPVETFATNVLGTAHVLEAVRHCHSVRAVINVTTDKVYDNREWVYSYREIDRLGGFDPYSSSKACSELVTAAYRDSFFNATTYADHGVAIATARSGNVIGGGDWARDRLVPDAMRAFADCRPVKLRYPGSTRPWQHVLEPLSGYLLLAEKLHSAGSFFSGAWNFGPRSEDTATVGEVMRRLVTLWGGKASFEGDGAKHPHEAGLLSLDNTKARLQLGWMPQWDLQTSLEKTVEWYKAFYEDQNSRSLCQSQIRSFSGASL